MDSHTNKRFGTTRIIPLKETSGPLTVQQLQESLTFLHPEAMIAGLTYDHNKALWNLTLRKDKE